MERIVLAISSIRVAHTQVAGERIILDHGPESSPTGPSAQIKPHQRIPSLDGLRALSIILVLLAHLAGTRDFPLTREIQAVGEIGFLGVRVFFVISGFLITILLLDEIHFDGSVSLKDFYFRRFLRIFPACYFYLAVVALLGLAGLVPLRSSDLYHGYSYTMNFYQARRAWQVGHLWSLSVEEQFYLLWPGILALFGARRGMLAAFGAILLSPIVRIVTQLWFRSQAAGISESFQTVADALATGCLLAGMRQALSGTSAYLRFLQSKWFSVVPFCLIASFLTLRITLFSELIGETVMNVSIALLIDRCVRFPHDAFGRFLNTTPMIWIGTLSYSLYLWQQPFLNRRVDSLVCSFPLNLVLAIAAAYASCTLVEKPFLSLRQRLRHRPV